MIKKKMISVTTVIIMLLLIIANIPTVSAYVPTGPPGDPPLDPAEAWYPGIVPPPTPYTFFYGHSPNYGSYIRDFQWASPGFGWDLYIGMLSVPTVFVNGVQYTFASNAVARGITTLAPGHIVLTFTYMPMMDVNGDVHNFMVVYDIWHTPPAPISPAPGSDLLINITITDTIFWTSPWGGGWVFDVPVRADLDIVNLTNPPANDVVHVYTSNPSPPPPTYWQQQNAERRWNPATRITDSTYNMEVMMNDTNMSSTWPASPWAGIVPPWACNNPATDIFYLVLYWANEYLGPPSGYWRPRQGFRPPPGKGADIVVWDDTFLLIQPPPGGPGTNVIGSTNLRIWMQ